MSQNGGPSEGGRWKDQRDKKQVKTIRFEIDEVEIGGGARCTRQRKGGVLLLFSRVKIRLSWHQQEFTKKGIRSLVRCGGLSVFLTCGFALSSDLQVGTTLPSDKDPRHSLVRSPPFWHTFLLGLV